MRRRARSEESDDDDYCPPAKFAKHESEEEEEDDSDFDDLEEEEEEEEEIEEAPFVQFSQKPNAKNAIFPHNVLIHILQYIGKAHKLIACSLVCQDWYAVSRRSIVYINASFDNLAGKHPHYLFDIIQSKRLSKQLVGIHLGIYCDHAELLARKFRKSELLELCRLCPNLKEVRMGGSMDMTEDAESVFRGMLSLCPKLSRITFMPGFSPEKLVKSCANLKPEFRCLDFGFCGSDDLHLIRPLCGQLRELVISWHYDDPSDETTPEQQPPPTEVTATEATSAAVVTETAVVTATNSGDAVVEAAQEPISKLISPRSWLNILLASDNTGIPFLQSVTFHDNVTAHELRVTRQLCGATIRKMSFAGWRTFTADVLDEIALYPNVTDFSFMASAPAKDLARTLLKLAPQLVRLTLRVQSNGLVNSLAGFEPDSDAASEYPVVFPKLRKLKLLADSNRDFPSQAIGCFLSPTLEKITLKLQWANPANPLATQNALWLRFVAERCPLVTSIASEGGVPVSLASLRLLLENTGRPQTAANSGNEARVPRGGLSKLKGMSVDTSITDSFLNDVLFKLHGHSLMELSISADWQKVSADAFRRFVEQMGGKLLKCSMYRLGSTNPAIKKLIDDKNFRTPRNWFLPKY